jgi:hypothetical protein
MVLTWRYNCFVNMSFGRIVVEIKGASLPSRQTGDLIMHRTSKLFAALVLGMSTLPAIAQTPAPAAKDPAATPRLDRREARQEQRIEQGVKSGQLNAKEAARLEKREERLKANEAKAKADGTVTPQERARLEREANRDSRAIAREKHDRQKAAK